MAKHEQLVFAALAALRPVAPLLDVVLSVQQQLRQAGGGGSNAYTVVQLKVEDAWIAQCAAWAAKGACVASGSHVMWKRRPVAVHVGHSGLMQQVPGCFKIVPLLPMPAGMDNCLNNTDTVGEQLALHTVDKQASAHRTPLLCKLAPMQCQTHGTKCPVVCRTLCCWPPTGPLPTKASSNWP